MIDGYPAFRQGEALPTVSLVTYTNDLMQMKVISAWESFDAAMQELGSILDEVGGDYDGEYDVLTVEVNK
jgi:hypothetical protein